MKWLRPFFVLACVASGCSVPSFGFQSVSEQTLNACRDGKLSPGEADVDCGRVCNQPCASGSTCNDDVDCSSVFCSAGTCTDQTCDDNLKNQDESDVDCGGDTGCNPCASGRACNSTSDCASAICTGSICRAPQTCSDKQKDQDESDVDCGGNTGCDRCAAGKLCGASADCDGGACMAGVCHAPSCNDGVKNQTESDVDCGGSCSPCADGMKCGSAADCNMALCTGGKCRAQSCSDGLLNQDETDVDCGGVSGCAPCSTGQHCVANTDCDHASCSKGICQPTSCTDGVLNGSETDVDCGGSCKGCAALAGCLVAKDCASSVCTMTTHKCAAATCSDGVLNGTEPTTDCGASCPNKCRIADTCAVAADCVTKTCTGQRCVTSDIPLPTTGWIPTASATEAKASSVPSSAIDGNLNTHWTSGTGQMPGMWFMLDMLKPQTFFSIAVIDTSQPTDYGASMRVSTSLDGTTFTVLRTDIAGSTSLKIPFADAQTARYLKLEVLSSPGGGGLWWRIDELQVLQ
jgi:hypothetical protein